jgi:hypothetical protein
MSESNPTEVMPRTDPLAGSINLIKIGLLVIILAWGMRGVIASFAQYGIGNTQSSTVYKTKLAQEQDEAAEEDILARGEKEAELQELDENIDAAALRALNLEHGIERERAKDRDDDDDSESDQDRIDDSRDDLKDLSETIAKLRIDKADLDMDLANIKGDIREAGGVIEREQFVTRTEADLDSTSGAAAFLAYHQWNLLLAPISMLLYIAGVLCLCLGNLGVLVSGTAAGGLRTFSIVSTAVVLYLMLLDAIDLHGPEGPSSSRGNPISLTS